MRVHPTAPPTRRRALPRLLMMTLMLIGVVLATGASSCDGPPRVYTASFEASQYVTKARVSAYGVGQGPGGGVISDIDEEVDFAAKKTYEYVIYFRNVAKVDLTVDAKNIAGAGLVTFRLTSASGELVKEHQFLATYVDGPLQFTIS